MPVLQLLWGSDTLTPEQCISDGGKITDTIMHNLQRRVSADRIVVSGLGGANKTRTKSELQNSILHSFPIKGQSFSYMRIKKNIEMSLVPWVVAEPKAFPELKAMSFVFAHTMPVRVPSFRVATYILTYGKVCSSRPKSVVRLLADCIHVERISDVGRNSESSTTKRHF
ncbi:hypothetical protein ACJQWK_09832 [Exserohilum turcicum]